MKTIRGKMLLGFCLPLVLLLSLLGVVSYLQVWNTAERLTKELSQEVLSARSAEIGRLMAGYRGEIRAVARRRTITDGTSDDIRRDLAELSGALNDDYEMLFHADASGNFITTTGAEGNVADRAYFKAIVHDGMPETISDPVLSRASGNQVFVVAHEVVNGRGERTGLVAATVLLKTLSGIAESIRLGEKGFGYVVDHNGLLIAHPNDSLRMKLNLLQSNATGYVGLEEVGRRMVKGEPGVLSYKRPNGDSLVTIFNPIPNTPAWALGVSMYEVELLGPANRLMRHLIVLMIGILVVVLLIVIVISGRIASPVRLLKDGADVISSGDLDHRLDIRTGDEIEALAGAFNAMTGALKEHIRNLERTTAEKARFEGELRIANNIQASMLPRLFPPFPEMRNLDLFATMEPARNVGGDFYDFFLIDDHRLCFSIGDVSGKGIPAALFMVITRTILKNLILQGHSLSETFRLANNMLCSDNIECMFVTVFMGVMDTKKGTIDHVNAGHNPPLLSCGGGAFEYLRVGRGLVLGGIEDSEYPRLTDEIKPDDTLFLYTDGVTEAMNNQDELFSDKRLVQVLNQARGLDVKAVIAGVREEMRRFVQDTPASDDVTMLAFSLKLSE
ncbi:MAG: SpoIIE family protein phosphatase [Pseudomonadota bacterium]